MSYVCCCCQPGPQGPSGPPGPGVPPAYFNAVANGGAQDVPPEGDVQFLLANQSGDFAFVPNTGVVTVNTGGVYRIDFSVTIRPSLGVINSAYALVINGVEHPLSFFGEYLAGQADTLRHQLTGFVVAQIPAGSTVSLRNKSADLDLLAGTGVNNQVVNRAALLMHRIA